MTELFAATVEEDARRLARFAMTNWHRLTAAAIVVAPTHPVVAPATAPRLVPRGAAPVSGGRFAGFIQ